MVSDHISVLESWLRHDLVVFRIDAVVPSYDVAQADAESVVTVHPLDEFCHVVRLFGKVGQLASFADLRVCYDDYVMVCVILGVLLHHEIIFLDVLFDFLVEKSLTFES